jgi:hypothetical protein
VDVKRVKREVRQKIEGVYVRFTPADMDTLRLEARRLDMSIPELLCERCLRSVGAAGS